MKQLHHQPLRVKLPRKLKKWAKNHHWHSLYQPHTKAIKYLYAYEMDKYQERYQQSPEALHNQGLVTAEHVKYYNEFMVNKVRFHNAWQKRATIKMD